MRYLLLSLVLLNILYALWQLQGSPVDSPLLQSSAPPVAALPPLQSPPLVESSPLPSDEVALCVTLGEFGGSTEAEQLRQRLLALDIDSRLQAREVISGTDYWLVMPVV
ncbi:hypothetical protein [Pseudomonas sp. FME51]|uniref:hypothetical protein n=1 Tax=Pseudomonas sp. FME51 TaxID=2742609 RepID=UPI0018666EBC|nr:hypothetical protein [Pseudomonas sp. FME51]